MDVEQFTSPISYRFDSSAHPLLRIGRLATALGVALIVCLGVIVVIRGWLGEFETPRSSVSLVLAAVAAELLASAFRMVWRRLHPNATLRSALVPRLAVPTICVLCLVVAMSMTGANGWTVGSLWVVLAGGELAWWYAAMRAWQGRALERTAAVGVEAVPDDEAFADEQAAFNANVIQQMTRSRNDDGVEVISGVLRAEFAAGERTQNLHVAFCPPLAYEPMVIAHQLDGPPLTIKVAQVEVFGTRIELRRGATVTPSESATICFEVHPR